MNKLKNLSFLLTIVLFFFLVPGKVLAVDVDQLKKYLTVEAAILGASDNVSVDFQKLDGSSEVSINPSRSWIPASTIKAYVLVEVFNQVRQGFISFDETVTVKARNVVATSLETDDFPRLREGTQVTIRQLAEAMIIQSDNTAYNSLIDILDRRSINDTLKSLGLTETVVGEKLNLDDGQYQDDTQTPGYQYNTTTVKDFATLFSLLANNKIPGSPEMLAIFKRQKFNDMIPSLIPKSIPVAHKTGFWAPIYHDGGIVYKPGEPFILGIFSNDNDPTINARLAKVAYYQDSDSVGLSMDPGPDPANKQSSNDYPVITLAHQPDDQNMKVLAAETNSKFPLVTAADLGITIQDLKNGLDDAGNIKPAVIYPGSWLYLAKRGFEDIRLVLAGSDKERINVLLDLANTRLSEIKAMKNSDRPDEVGLLIKDVQANLSQSVNLIAATTKSEAQLTRVKQLSDISFAVTGDSMSQAKGRNKEKLVDDIYASYQRNQKEVAPIVQKSLPTSPFNQPLIGTVQEVKADSLTVAFTDSSTKIILINQNTPSRAFGQKVLDKGTPQASVGARIAVVGEMTRTGEIVPNFVLRNIPKEIPEKKEGIVIKIDPKNSSMEIKQSNGQNVTLIIDSDTVLKGRNTNVSLSGIKAGSTVTSFGSTIPATVSATTTAVSPEPETVKKDVKTKTLPAPTSKTPEIVHVKAITITVTKNSSGKDEVIAKTKKVSLTPVTTTPKR